MKAVALLVAAGSGERLGAGRPKAFVVLAGRPMIEWSLAALRAAPSVSRIVVALPPDHEGGLEGVTAVPGGVARSHSVRNALAAAGDCDAVVVHDAARPLASAELFEATIAALDGADAAIAATPVTDTVKQAGADLRVTATLDRSRLWAIQTPQAFRSHVLRAALDAPDEVLAAATDDAALVEARGGIVRIVEAPPENLKVTTPLDLLVAEALLARRRP
jgi:2-C-methyl-D-erythritol 4-phosphate cytidylyltransferase